MLLVAPISSRNSFAAFLVERGLHGDAVEVGTHRGEFARIFMLHWPGRLYCVDPWDTPPGYEGQAKYLEHAGASRDEDMAAAARALAPYRERVFLLRQLSTQAVGGFPDESLDFVYLDADHSFAAVLNDLYIWWPKLRRGGLLAGHDFICPGPAGPDNWGRSVQPAVMAFAARVGVDVELVCEEGCLPWSYAIWKP